MKVQLLNNNSIVSLACRVGDLNDVGKPLLINIINIIFIARNRLYRNSIQYQQYLNGLNSRLDRIKGLKAKYEEIEVIS